MADKEFNVKISAETDAFSKGMSEAERESSELADTLSNEVSNSANDASESLKGTIGELRKLMSEAIGTTVSVDKLSNSLNITTGNTDSATSSVDRLGNETSSLDEDIKNASSATNNLGVNLNELNNDARQACRSISELKSELRELHSQTIGINTSINGMGNSFSDSSKQSNKFNKEMQKLSMALGGEVPESTKKAYSEMYKLHEEARKASRYYGKYSQEALNARDAITNFALGLDDATFKQIYMRSQLGLTDGQLRQQANSIKLNARMTKLMGNQLEILTNRMKGLQKFGIKPEMMLPPSTIGQFQMLNDIMKTNSSITNNLSLGYRLLGGKVESTIKSWSAQKMAIKTANGDMVKYGKTLTALQQMNANLALALPIVGMSAIYAYGAMFKSALNADKSLKKLAETTKGKVVTALQPVIKVAGQFLEVALNVVSAVSDWIIKFNEAHPALAKIAGVIGFLLPIMTLFGLTIVGTIGAIGGWKVALAGVWPMIGGVVTMIGTASATFLTFAGIIALVGAAFVNLWNTNEQFRNGVKELVNEIISAGTSILQTVMQLVATIVPIIQSTLDAIMSFWTEHKDVIIPIVQLMWSVIRDTILGAINAIKNIIQGGLTIISGIINVFKAIAEGDFSAMWEAIKEIFRGAIQLVIGLVQGWLVTGALKAFKGLWTGAKSIIKSMWTSISNFFKSGITNCISFIKNLVSTGISNFNTLKTFGANIFNALWQTIKSSMSKVVDAVKSGMDNAINFLRSIDLFSIGKNIIQGLVNGVKSMAKTLVNSVKGVVSNAIEGAKKLLGINSPSKLFMQFGKWTTEGYQIGVDRGEPASTRAIEDFANNSINAFTTTALPSVSENTYSNSDTYNNYFTYNAGSTDNTKDFDAFVRKVDRKLAEIKMNKSLSKGGGRIVYG